MSCCVIICSVTDLSQMFCNSSIFLPPSNSAVYIANLQQLMVPSPTALAFTAAASSSSCPLRIVAERGQTINVTLRSFFSPPPLDHVDDDDDVCPAQLVIWDGRESHSHPLCRSRQRERNAYVSLGNTISLYLRHHQHRQMTTGFVARWNFVLKIEGGLRRIRFETIIELKR